MTGPSPEPDRGQGPAGAPAALKELAIVGAIIAALGAVLFYWVLGRGRPEGPDRARSGADRGETPSALFVGDKACAECHPGELAHHRRSGHSRTLRPASDPGPARMLDGKTVRDEEYDAVWSYSLRDGAVVADRSEDGRLEQILIDYAVGSGHHATTFVSLTDRSPTLPASLEHRLTYFAGDGSLRTTPGQTKDTQVDPEELTPSGRALGAEKTLECFGCHATLLSAGGRNELDAATMIPNVTCERCHGPGREHVAAALRGEGALKMPFGPGRATAPLQMRLCGQCHRHPDRAPPGSIHPDNLGIVRFQPVGLMQSRCYTRSKGALMCTTCHNPHDRVTTDRAGHEAACLSCHQARPQAVCPVSPSTGCVSCHMPARDSGQGILFHDHWIRINPTDRPPEPD